MGIIDRVAEWMGPLYFGKLAARRNIRLEIRGYRLLSRSAERGLVGKINQELTQQNLMIDQMRLSNFMFGKDVQRVEIAVRQRLLSQLAGRRLNLAILRSIASSNERIAIPLPLVWIEKLLKDGFAVDKPRSRVMFAIFVLSCFGRGTARILWDLAGIRGSNPLEPNKKYVQFQNLVPNNLPKLYSGESFDIVSWYLGWSGRVEGICEVRHSVPFQVDRCFDDGVAIIYSRSNLPKIVNFESRLRFATWGVYSIFYTMWDMLCGRWASAVLLEDVAIARKVQLVGTKFLASEYLFSQSEIISRPFWTYAAERLGSKITLYCYGGSIPFSFMGVAPHYEIGLQSITWPRILQFSKEQQLRTISAVCSSVRVEFVPPIHFSDSVAELPKTNGPCIAVFDSSPHRSSFRASVIPEDDFRTVEIGIQFLEEIYAVLFPKGYLIMWKKKRSTNYQHSKRYIKFADSFACRPGVVEVHPDIAAQRVIKHCFASISMPFTSTGLLAKYAKIPSVFYDPAGTLSPDDQANLGVPLIVGVVALKNWVGELTYSEEFTRDALK
jgi:polysaccharide biosynthesis PFTS motif protein